MSETEVKKRGLTPMQRVQRIMSFNYKRGLNKESVNNVYRKIINLKLKNNKNN